MNTISKLILLTALSLCTVSYAQDAPKALLPVPADKQVEWQKMETYAFIHFGLNTFNDMEWGYGDTPASKFNPAKLDCEQWVKTLVGAGMKGVIITAKHHDGFCLWQTKYTDYCVRNSPWKNGKGDVLAELSAACRKYNIKCAFYLSPWDRHQAFYGTPLYVDYFHKQLEEILTKYGDVFEVWFDGANGGDGWYGGMRESRTIDRKTYYDYPTIYKIIDKYQPNAVVFSDGGPGCRWVGNESGFAGATNWSFLRKGVVYAGYSKYYELTNGHADGDQWTAAECDVSIRPGWFYHPEQDKDVKSVENLTDLYYKSVGHNATLLLNFPVDRNGLINPIDSANAVNFHKNILKHFKNNLLKGIKGKVSSELSKKYGSNALTDGDYETYWATPEKENTGSVSFKLRKTEKINCLLLQEYIPLGQRVKSFVIEYKDKAKWTEVTCNEECTTVGYKRLVRFKTITAKELRVRFTDSRGQLCINNIEAYYTGVDKMNFNKPLAKLESYKFTIQGLDATEQAKATDRDVKTTCFVDGDKITIDLGTEKTVKSLHYMPDQSTPGKGLIHSYTLSTDKKLLKKGEFSNIQNNPILQSVYFTPTSTRYIILKADRMVNKDERIGFSEIAVQ